MLPQIAIRNLGRNRARTVVAGLAVAVAVAALVFADAWARGIGDAIREYAASSRLGAVQLHAPGYLDNVDAFSLDRTLAIDDAVLTKLAVVPGVHGVAPRVRFAATGGNGNDETMVMGLGVDPAAESVACPRFLADDLQAGRTLGPDDTDVVLVGSGLARSLKLAPGSTMVLEARDARGRQNAIDVEVVGVASSSLPDEAKWLVIAPIGTAQRLLGLTGRATSIVVGGDANDVEGIAARVRSAMNAPSGAAAYDVRTWREIGVYFEQAVKTFAFAQAFLMGVLAVLVTLVVLNVAVVTTTERTKEIGTLTALGATAATVRTLLVMESAVFGAVAGAIGAALGMAASAAAAVNGVPFAPPNQPVVLVHPHAHVAMAIGAVVGAVVLCALGTIIPAIVASRAHPATALRSVG